MDQVTEILADTPGISGSVIVGGHSLLDSVVSPNAGVAWVVLDHWDERSTDETQVQAQPVSPDGKTLLRTTPAAS